eukprot:Gregarina_sp_Poly_1__2771@NODE_176_length_12008_cov_147_545264_g156_i0_p4_GENE_NODE_176_length_12008_cov_147_545264_g156_i0NODE_176_length_12008_cov_147_545264_g156_i0_p4_ORF_typecomplete_len373_score40_37IIGP/PF05049_13/1e52MMR_HSR1/PF01926_23/2_3e10AIG1/PF04548_16/1_7e06FeoB_N/PF02421_18/8_1e06RsgA_GTPase/PF03193_16/0_00018RsgA_GTPase/PF03193_16/5_3e02AAA_15/PF13175_6/2_2e03AAA_15/PF13175_6/8_9e05Roc/PF08477_13/3_4e03Roc/PF08477_13/0_0017Dynamin_N/PF00350_23/0_012GBP/PF02263_19/0_31GBP/PF02263
MSGFQAMMRFPRLLAAMPTIGPFLATLGLAQSAWTLLSSVWAWGKGSGKSVPNPTMELLEKLLREQERLRREWQDSKQKNEHQMQILKSLWQGATQMLGSVMSKDPPNLSEFEETKRKYEYREDMCHVAVTGNAGVGKSSFINAIRGLKSSSKAQNVAKVGSSLSGETKEAVRYSDPDPNLPIAWYDIPGAGTIDVPRSKYFKSQGLYMFDCIIVVVDTRFTETDKAILDCSRDWKIPTLIVRSKSDQHIMNESYENSLSKVEATEKYTTESNACISETLREASLPSQRLFLVSREGLRNARNGSLQSSEHAANSEDYLDEIALIGEITEHIVKTRAPKVFSEWPAFVANLADMMGTLNSIGEEPPACGNES